MDWGIGLLRVAKLDGDRSPAVAIINNGRRARLELLRCKGGDIDAVTEGTDVDILALEEALNVLAELHMRQAQVVELRFFGGLSVEEVAESLDVSPRTIKMDWQVARAWLRRRLDEDRDENESEDEDQRDIAR